MEFVRTSIKLVTITWQSILADVMFIVNKCCSMITLLSLQNLKNIPFILYSFLSQLPKHLMMSLVDIFSFVKNARVNLFSELMKLDLKATVLANLTVGKLEHAGSALLLIACVIIFFTSLGFNPESLTLLPGSNQENNKAKLNISTNHNGGSRQSYLAAIFGKNDFAPISPEKSSPVANTPPRLTLPSVVTSTSNKLSSSGIGGSSPPKAVSEQQNKISLRKVVGKIMSIPKSPKSTKTPESPERALNSNMNLGELTPPVIPPKPYDTPIGATPSVFRTVTTAQKQAEPQESVNATIVSPSINMIEMINAQSAGQKSATDSSDDNMSESNASSYTASSEVTFQSSLTANTLASSMRDQPFQSVLRESTKDPKVLIGWKILVAGYGTGVVLSIRRKRFSTTRFMIQFESGKLAKLALKRSTTKGDVPFTLISKTSS